MSKEETTPNSILEYEQRFQNFLVDTALTLSNCISDPEIRRLAFIAAVNSYFANNYMPIPNPFLGA